MNINNYPAVQKHLSQFKESLNPKPNDWKGDEWKGRKPGAYQWYEIQDTIDYYAEFEKPKIMVPAIVKVANYAFDSSGFYSNDKTTIIPCDDLYLLGILNSKVSDLVIHSISSTKRGGYFEYKPMYVQKIPIRLLDFSDPQDLARHDRMVSMVKTMLSLHKQLQQTNNPHEKTIIKHQIEASDCQID